MPDLPPTPDRPPVRRGIVFSIIAFALIMMALDATIVATALHAMQHELGTTVNWAGWTITAYSFGFVLMLPITGKLSAQYGRRRVFLASVITFTLASLCCGMANDIYTLIALRAVQAAGGAGFTPSATGIVVDHFGTSRDRYVSLFGSIFPVGAMIGPIFGGLFVTYWSWRGVFLVNVPIGLAIALLTLHFIPRDPPPAPRVAERKDPFGLATLGIGVLTAMLAASVLGEKSAAPLSVAFLAPMALSAVAVWIFIRHTRRSTHPFIAPRLIWGRNFGAVNLFNALVGGVKLGAIALVPLYATNRYGLNALDSGTLLTAQGLAGILFTLCAALALRRSGYRPPLYIGTLVMVLGMVLLALPPPPGTGAYLWLAIGAFLTGAGGGIINPASRNAGLQLAPKQASTLAALRSMGLQIGAIATISIATAIIAASNNPGHAQAWFYIATAILFIVALPIIRRMPEYHGAW